MCEGTSPSRRNPLSEEQEKAATIKTNEPLKGSDKFILRADGSIRVIHFDDFAIIEACRILLDPTEEDLRFKTLYYQVGGRFPTLAC